ncbi:MAG: HAMP domain-containing sensor histidine kinase, partial [Planctomycetota bacterium]
DKLAAYVFATLGSFACLSFLLIWFVYSKVFGPLRELHRCVTRVAHGDFDYDVPVRRRDEIGELAEAFNQMTARFRETRDGLDRQVRERSMQLVRSERLAGVGFLSAGVAHEINNPLSAIAMAAESFETRADRLFGCLTPTDRAWAGKKLAMIQRESFRCQTITRRLLDFARGSGTERHDADLNTLVGEVLELVSHMTKFKDRSIVFEPGDPAFAAVNAGEIKQVMLNLVSNSLAATDPGGTLKIEVVGTTDTALLTFADDGCGMSEETIEHLFEPFFTRQRDGRGTGLGMSISNRIVTDHGGTIEVASDGEGLGSTFTVTLPRKAVGLPRAA